MLSNQFYIVVRTFGDLGFEAQINEHSQCSRAALIRDIAQGHYENTAQVIHVDLTRGTNQDVTTDILDAASRYGEAA